MWCVPQSIWNSSVVDVCPKPDEARPVYGNGVCWRLRRSSFERDHDAAVRAIQKHKGLGYPLASPIRSLMEEHFGCNLAAIRIHTDAFAEGAAVSLSANAFTVQNDIF